MPSRCAAVGWNRHDLVRAPARQGDEAGVARYPEFEVPRPEARPPYGHLGHNFAYNAVFDREARLEPPHL
jgi:hypothetical protein